MLIVEKLKVLFKLDIKKKTLDGDVKLIENV